MSLRGVQPGAVIERIYYAVPGAYTIGETFEDWESAVRYAKGRRLELITALGASMEGYASAAQIQATADAQVRVDLRWVIRNPDGRTIDAVLESYRNVDQLLPKIN